MSRASKFVLGFIVAVIALFVVAAVAFRLFFDPNDFRDKIEKVVYEATGRELTIEGDVGLQLFPWLAVEIGPTRLGNAAGFGDEPFAEFDSAQLSVRLLPLGGNRWLQPRPPGRPTGSRQLGGPACR